MTASVRASSYKDKDELVLKLYGDLTHSSSCSFIRNIPNLENTKTLILDCRNLASIDGTGLIALSIIVSHCNQLNCKCYFSNLSGQPQKLLKRLGLTRYFYDKSYKSLFDKWILIPLGVSR